MPEFCIMKGREEIGLIDVNEKGFSIVSDHDITQLVQKLRTSFKEVGSTNRDAVSTHVFVSKVPTASYFEVLVKVRSVVVRENLCLGSDSIKCIS